MIKIWQWSAAILRNAKRVDVALWVPLAVLLLGCLLEIIGICHLNNGRLIYSLDDPYIHLALAENIARGHYGVNPGEISAPSSSILWPFLLVPFARLPYGDLAPLIINVLITVMIVCLCHRILARALESPEDTSQNHAHSRQRTVAIAGLTITFILVANLIGLIFTGMEHPLQVLLALLVVYGFIEYNRRGEVPWWFMLGIVGGPLIRYENLVLSLPALVFLFAQRRYALSVLSGLFLVLCLGGFSFFLHSNGLGLMPSSVVVKTGGNFVHKIPATLLSNLTHPSGLPLLLWGIVIFVGAFQKYANERALRFCMATAIAGHLLKGQFGWLERYEIYIWLTSMLSLFYLERARLRMLIEKASPLRLVMALLLFVTVVGARYIATTISTPIASNNIYEQHYQMHRFATDYYAAPVAVVDLGWVSLRNDHYVLDLWGLASRKAFALRWKYPKDGQWMNDLARQHNVRLAMIYPELLPPTPKNWILLGKLRLGRTRISALVNEVSFYALDPATAVTARDQLQRFQKTLPQGATFTFAKGSR